MNLRDRFRTRCGTSATRWQAAFTAVLVLVPVTFNAIMLYPELRLELPSYNDNATHYLLIRTANAALTAGDNPFDFWLPQLGLGFPQFLYYQHLPHLVVVALYRLLLERVPLPTLFNLVNYLLLVGFPLTVYCSMRAMEFSWISAAVAAACASLLSAPPSAYGFEYDSYIWSGNGLYTQLWAMHLFFIWLACAWRLLRRGIGYASSSLAYSALILSHPLYAYMALATIFPVLLISLAPGAPKSSDTGGPNSIDLSACELRLRDRILRALIRLAIVGVLISAITAYFWLPFIFSLHYFNLVPYAALPRAIFQRFGVGGKSWSWSWHDWHLLDHNRFPALTLLALIGTAYAAIDRSTPARLALAISVFWLVLYLSAANLPRLIGLLPMHQLLTWHRFTGPLDLGAILLIGLGGELIWRCCTGLSSPWNVVVPIVVIATMLAPVFKERGERLAQNDQLITQTAFRLDHDPDSRAMISILEALPPGRTYDLRPSSGPELSFYGIDTISPGQGLSLNSLMPFDRMNPTYCELFNVRYILLPGYGFAPSFLRLIKKTKDAALYQADTSGYASVVTAYPREVESNDILQAQEQMLRANYDWMHSAALVSGQYILWDYPAGHQSGTYDSGRAPSGTVSHEEVYSDRIDLSVDCPAAATLLLRMTYHPNWHVTIDDKEQATFMLSPSYIGVMVPAGHHLIRAEYRSSRLKKLLLFFGACSLLLVLWLRRSFAHLEIAAVRLIEEH
jgi:hypothetical protein